ncbi:MAG: hypothetical protein GW795_11535 [Cyanobacteria bacterium]|uniref:hypothetical protein n=1 Tax=Geminocystis sp. TaxID=2664100 RepID=UPI001DF9B7CE|nr:hypothetical protein [Cyanobacteria bacterium CG_2015-16_32_12]NCO78513.1 hypothetical protein [Cyanobacteria bacterium CG_2015-22_32_23]NCQ04857.1 hypothetical protein [Cyanobacteria bacterium CG_2015-09_32_10]NCQ42485.1 hypothetical protein [Cyanobacteria bacterium CG_2015-04_32_10]NCS85630.1 hypothetical protein [Cyanobacteria bacterium CG_2015-02_32_10]
MLSRQKETVKILALSELTSEEKRFQEERLRDVYLLLENLALNEEATIKLIIECLYDIGIINLINKKIPNRSMNKLAKFLSGTPKPLVKIIAWQWVKKNLPIKVTNWLNNKVKFK